MPLVVTMFVVRCRGATTFVVALFHPQPQMWLPLIRHSHKCGCLTSATTTNVVEKGVGMAKKARFAR